MNQDKIQRYNSTIKILKLFFALAAIILLLMIFLIPMLNKDDSTVQLTYSEAQVSNDHDKTVILNPVLYSKDTKGQVFTITATKGIQSDARDAIKLFHVEGDIVLKDNQTWILVSSDTGTIFTNKKYVKLMNNVEIFSSSGYELKTERATMQYDKNIIYGDKPVHIQSSFGTIDAEEFYISGPEKKLIFSNRVKTVIYPE